MDDAHKQTDALIDTTERKIKREYAKAQKEIERKANAYFASFADKDKKMLALVDEGKMSQDAYNAWRTQQLLVGKRWHDMSASLSQELANAREISASVVKGYMPEAYAENINFATYEIEAGTGIDTSYTLYDRQTVERIMRDNPQLLPDPSETIKDKIRQKQIDRWSRSKMTSALTQAILQGESIDKLAKRLRSVTSMDTAASIRNARTMMTNAQSAGRYDGYRRAKAMGVKFKVMWIATLDNRTRHEHRMLDGQMQEVDEPFNVGGINIMYPADYGGKTYKVPADMIYNCRCSIGAAVKGTRLYDEGIGAANREVGTGQTYEEWKNTKNTPSQNIERNIYDNVTIPSASSDWFEYEKANVMSEYIETGIIPKDNIYGTSITTQEGQILAAEAELIQNEGMNNKTEYKTLYRGMVMDIDEVRKEFTPGETYEFKTLSAATPDIKVASIYTNVENAGGEGVPVILEIQKPDGIYGFKRDETETVLPKGGEYKITRNYMDKDGVVHISLYSKKGNNIKNKKRNKKG